MNEKTWSKNRTRELINDLSAVRAAVLNQQPNSSAVDRAVLESRLFESWVIEKLVQSELRALKLEEDVAKLQEALETLRKNIPRPSKKSKKEKES